jgi:hypothetical protein
MASRGDPEFKEDKRSNRGTGQMDWLYATDVGTAKRLPGDGGPGPI